MFDPTKPVQTRDGRPARIVSEMGHGEFPLLALITNPDGREYVGALTLKGAATAFPGEHPGDLINVPDTEEVVAYVNLGISYLNLRGAKKEAIGWPVVKLKLLVGKENGLEDVREVLSAEVANVA